jgi:hypothetical protein
LPWPTRRLRAQFACPQLRLAGNTVDHVINEVDVLNVPDVQQEPAVTPQDGTCKL